MTQQIEQQKSDADILAEAREYMEQHGWCQGYNYDENTGSVCAYGAVVFSQNWQDEDHDCDSEYTKRLEQVLTKVVNVIGLTIQTHCPATITMWNDYEDRQEQEVLDAFMKAEKIERSGNVRED